MQLLGRQDQVPERPRHVVFEVAVFVNVVVLIIGNGRILRGIRRYSGVGRHVAERVNAKRVRGLGWRGGGHGERAEHGSGWFRRGGGGGRGRERAVERDEVGARLAEHGIGVQRRAGGLGERLQPNGHEGSDIVGARERRRDVNGPGRETVRAHAGIIVRSGLGRMGATGVEVGVGIMGRVVVRIVV